MQWKVDNYYEQVVCVGERPAGIVKNKSCEVRISLSGYEKDSEKKIWHL